MGSLIKKPSAWIPIAMSLTALAILIFYFLKFGVVHKKDEGIAAHLFQILIGGQIPIILFFAINWLPKKPKQALIIISIQIIVALIACFPVFYFKL